VIWEEGTARKIIGLGIKQWVLLKRGNENAISEYWAEKQLMDQNRLCFHKSI
jgi:hypothetical protein